MRTSTRSPLAASTSTSSASKSRTGSQQQGYTSPIIPSLQTEPSTPSFRLSSLEENRSLSSSQHLPLLTDCVQAEEEGQFLNARYMNGPTPPRSADMVAMGPQAVDVGKRMQKRSGEEVITRSALQQAHQHGQRQSHHPPM